jgi:lysophospholipase L1-like esterase
MLRIVALGDSMTFGHGVGLNETLPAHLESLLNRSVWDRHIEVINCGQDGLAIYDLWCVLATRARYYRPDLVVLVLCENDAMMNGASTEYQARVRESWRDDSITLPYFGLCCEKLAREAGELGIPLTVAFYYQRDNDVRHRCLKVISARCRQHGFDFVDLSAEFKDGVAERDWGRFRVSQNDPHPSSYGHHIAARALARHLLAAGRLSAQPTLAEAALVARCAEETAGMIAAGNPAAWVVPRLANVLAGKRSCRGRLALPADQRMANDELNRLRDEMELLAGWSVRLLGWRALLHQIADRMPGISAILQPLDRDLQMLRAKKLFVLESNLRDSRLAYQPCIHDPVEEGSGACLGPLAERLTGWLEILHGTSASLASLAPESGELLAPVATGLAAERDAVSIELARLWDEAGEIFAGYLRLTVRCQELFTELEAGAADEEPWCTLLRITTLLHSVEPSLTRWSELLMLKEARRLTSLPLVPCPRHTLVLVTMRSLDQGTGECLVLLRMEARLPVVSLADEQHLIRDGQRHVYRFELPIVALTSLTLWLERPDLSMLETMEIQTRPGASRIFNAEELASEDPTTFTTGRMIIFG